MRKFQGDHLPCSTNKTSWKNLIGQGKNNTDTTFLVVKFVRQPQLETQHKDRPHRTRYTTTVMPITTEIAYTNQA